MTDDPCRRYCRAKGDLLRSQDRYAILERERDYWKQETEGLRRERDQWQRSSGESFARAERLEDALEKSQARATAAEAAAKRLREAVIRAEKVFRWYGDLHATEEQTPENAAKMKRNDDMADAMKAALKGDAT